MIGIDWMSISALLLAAAIAETGYLVVVYREYREAKRRWEAQQ
jgi:Pyruvate/2-oxoacid:ferredoxin oxidoreductase gamma subunit